MASQIALLPAPLSPEILHKAEPSKSNSMGWPPSASSKHRKFRTSTLTGITGRPQSRVRGPLPDQATLPCPGLPEASPADTRGRSLGHHADSPQARVEMVGWEHRSSESRVTSTSEERAAAPDPGTRPGSARGAATS